MATRQRQYQNVHYKPQTILEILNRFAKFTELEDINLIANNSAGISTLHLRIGRAGNSVLLDELNDFLERDGLNANYWQITVRTRSHGIDLDKFNTDFHASASSSNNLAEADSLLAPLDADYEKSRISSEDILRQNVVVFIGHGRNPLWKQLKDHLTDHHGIKVVTYETGARAGFTIQEVLSEMTKQASLAFLVHTAEDIAHDGQERARENVVHETGLFQGKLSFKRAIVLLEEGCNEFSNIAGLQQIRFGRNNIKEVFGDVLAVLRREFGG